MHIVGNAEDVEIRTSLLSTMNFRPGFLKHFTYLGILHCHSEEYIKTETIKINVGMLNEYGYAVRPDKRDGKN